MQQLEPQRGHVIPKTVAQRGSTVRPTNICNKATRRWEALECGFGLFWNPDWNANITGGSCDEWDNLAAEIQNRYNSDAACFPPCYYEKNGECSNNYIYHPAGSDHRVSQTLECPSNLVWADEMQTCDRCDHVMDDVKGVNCCGSISEPGNGGGGGGPIQYLRRVYDQLIKPGLFQDDRKGIQNKKPINL